MIASIKKTKFYFLTVFSLLILLCSVLFSTLIYAQSCLNGDGVNCNNSPSPSVVPKVTVDLKPDQTFSVTQGSSTTLSWTSNNANSCTASGAWSGNKRVSGGRESVIVGQKSTYVITCTNKSSTASDSVTVDVIFPVPPKPPVCTTYTWRVDPAYLQDRLNNQTPPTSSGGRGFGYNTISSSQIILASINNNKSHNKDGTTTKVNDTPGQKANGSIVTGDKKNNTSAPKLPIEVGKAYQVDCDGKYVPCTYFIFLQGVVNKPIMRSGEPVGSIYTASPSGGRGSSTPTYSYSYGAQRCS